MSRRRQNRPARAAVDVQAVEDFDLIEDQDSLGADQPRTADEPEEADTEPCLPVVPAPAQVETLSRVVICAGRAVTSRRGILGPGAVATADDFSGGADTLASLVAGGYAVQA